MNAPAKPIAARHEQHLPWLAIPESELIDLLRSSLYPGAADNSIKMVVSYCKAQHLDIMQKPVHIVPMPVKTGRKDANGYDETVMRDVVMPGIGLYRTQAARTGQYAGMSEPEFGPPITLKLGSKNTEVTFPEWCKIVVKRFVNDVIVEFPAKEYWLENYAVKSRSDAAPNAMWMRRKYGQLAKCAEAQALRKGFPEVVSAEATADEMEGKYGAGDTFDSGTGEVISAGVRTPQPRASTSAAEDAVVVDAEFVEEPAAQPQPAATPKPTATPDASVSPKASAGQIKMIRTKAGQKNLAEAQILECWKLASLEDATVAVGNEITKWIGEQP